MQKTVVLNYNGTPIVSKPFVFKHACIIDDQRYLDGGLATGSRNALIKMYEGTILTEKIIDEDIDMKELKIAREKVLDMYLCIDKEVKN